MGFCFFRTVPPESQQFPRTQTSETTNRAVMDTRTRIHDYVTFHSEVSPGEAIQASLMPANDQDALDMLATSLALEYRSDMLATLNTLAILGMSRLNILHPT